MGLLPIERGRISCPEPSDAFPIDAMELARYVSSGAQDETGLVERARAGDRAAFDEIVRGHYERVYGLLFRLIGNHEDAEDLAQQCFVRAYRSLAWYRGDSALSTWLFQIALHLAHDHGRARGRRPEHEELAERGAPGERGPADELAGRELAALLRAALERLPSRLRTAFVLRALEGLEYDEVARICGIAPGTARMHVMKARRELVRRLGHLLDRSPR